MPIAEFHKVTIYYTWKGYGTYKVQADYKGKNVTAIDHDSETYDVLKLRDVWELAWARNITLKEARCIYDSCRRHTYEVIRRAYEEQYKSH